MDTEKAPAVMSHMSLPSKGKPLSEIRAIMSEARREDADWRNGKIWSLVYYAGDDILEVAKEAYLTFFSENGPGLRAFPSLQRFESEVMSMTADLLGGEHATGNLTSGGTESNLLAAKTARDKASAERHPIKEPEIILPVTAHPALYKAAHYLGLKVVQIPVGEDFRADVSALDASITDNTVLIVGSAPCYPWGVVDPIPQMAGIAAKRGICCHVDASLGGFVLPFLRRLGYAVPEFDFRVPGVTSINADVHKNGYAAKCASALLYRDTSIYQYQPFEIDDLPLGPVTSPTMTFSRPGGATAAAWAILQYVGQEGYLRIVQKAMDLTRMLQDGINGIPGLIVRGKPDMSVFAYGSRTLDIYEVADELEWKGWYVNRSVKPPSINLVVTPAHDRSAAAYLADLRTVAESLAKGHGTKRRKTETTIFYG